MARILVPRGSSATPAASASSNSNSNPPHRSSSTSSAPPSQSLHSSVTVNDEELTEAASELVVVDDVSEQCGAGGHDHDKAKSVSEEAVEIEKACSSSVGGGGLRIFDRSPAEREGSGGVNALQMMSGDSYPPPPPVPPPKPSVTSSNIVRRFGPGSSNSIRTRRAVAWPVVSPSGSRPSSPRSHGDGEGYNSADEQNPCFGSSYDDAERERQFELDIRRATGLEIKRMLEDGNCLFRAVADQVYGDSEVYDLTRQMCIDYMERERDHFSQFITEGFTSYCKRKRRDKVYGNNVEIQALSEMYNRPIHIYSCSTEPINIFHGSYDTDTPPIRLSYHHGNHYNSLVDPCRLTIGAGLGFSSLRGRNIDKEQVKAAIKAQQDQQIDKALLAEGRFYSDIELTEKEMERMVMEASRAEYLAADKFKRQASRRESSTSGAEPSSSGARPSGSDAKKLKEGGASAVALSSSMQMVLSMGFSYLQVIEAYSIFGDDVDSVVCYLLETGNSSRRKGKATE